MEQTRCHRGCCEMVSIRETVVEPDDFIKDTTYRIKAGVILYNDDSIMITQSYNNYWGVPKGSVDEGDNDTLSAAVREMKEETGIDLSEQQYEKKLLIMLYHKLHVFYLYRTRARHVPRLDLGGNMECTGVGWMKRNCILRRNQTIKINAVTKMVAKNLERI